MGRPTISRGEQSEGQRRRLADPPNLWARAAAAGVVGSERRQQQIARDGARGAGGRREKIMPLRAPAHVVSISSGGQGVEAKTRQGGGGVSPRPLLKRPRRRRRRRGPGPGPGPGAPQLRDLHVDRWVRRQRRRRLRRGGSHGACDAVQRHDAVSEGGEARARLVETRGRRGRRWRWEVGRILTTGRGGSQGAARGRAPPVRRLVRGRGGPPQPRGRPPRLTTWPAGPSLC